MMTCPRYGDMGASLYVPATHKSLESILADGCHGARSLILCTEDAVAADAVAWAVRRLIRTLQAAPAQVTFLRFVRPRNPFVLRQLIEVPEALARLDGVVIPKFDDTSAPEWHDVLERCPQLPVMPTLETPSLFREDTALATLEAVQSLRNPVIALRIGANDLLGAIGLKRQPGQTVYETPLRSTLERLITLFRPAGYELAAPVCDLIGETETLSREVAQDIAWGFYSKTCVHPSQLAVIEEHFAQALRRQKQQAHALLNSHDAVFQDAGQMLEQACHSHWARRIATLQSTS
ncbi:aldolase/citrate lyase family protein [Modicisalibacter coralii]|uniref:aldolase/citrate lyase family protein n=1 Tax=Modicisalibacter coralii TaxID=2304602 RepID=UPI00100BA3F1|nr:aldolase/citrate lyase family protein [Halomonas coralii]